MSQIKDRAKKRSLPVASTRWTPELLAGVAEGERRALRPLFDRGVDGAVDAAVQASERAAELERAALARDPPPTPVACRKGCSSCCVSKVVVVAPEVIRIAEHLRRTLDEGALAALLDRVRAADERTRGLTRAERAEAGVPCPLLEDGACSIHPVRPLLCRGWGSLDASACERHFADPARVPVAPAYVPAYELASAVLAGLGRAALDAGRDGKLLELVAALRIALERPGAGERWNARLGVFSRAADAEVEGGRGGVVESAVPSEMDTIRSDKLSAALDRAVQTGETAELFDLLGRSSGLPGPKPNLDLARAVGHAIARHEGRADRLLHDLASTEQEFPRIVAAMAFAARSLAPAGKKRAPAWVETALADLQQLAEDPRHLVRIGIVEALRMRLDALGEPAVDELAAWTDGYLQAHVALEALADRTLLTKLPSAAPVLARLDEAFVLADASPRSAERSQGMRTLRQGMPAQIAVFAARYPEAIAWVEARTASKRPETREVVAGAISALRRSVISDLEAQRLSGLLTASGKPRRDADRVVHGTRKRGRGRT